MSVPHFVNDLFPADRVHAPPDRWPRRLALLSGLTLIGSFSSVLYHITDVVGGTGWLVAVIGISLLAGTVAGRIFPLVVGLSIGGLLLGVGVGAYLHSIPNAYVAVLSSRIITDVARLPFGDMSLLQTVQADFWAITIAPAPVFGTWYLVVRRRYDLGAWVGGLTLGFFILIGDASEIVSLVGMMGILAVLGFGTLDHYEASWEHIQEVGLLLAGVMVFTRLVRPVTARMFSSSMGPFLSHALIDAQPANSPRACSIATRPTRHASVTRRSRWSDKHL